MTDKIKLCSPSTTAQKLIKAAGVMIDGDKYAVYASKRLLGTGKERYYVLYKQRWHRLTNPDRDLIFTDCERSGYV